MEGKRLEELIQENLGWLRGWFRGRLKDPGFADDLCQDTFLRAFRNLSRLRDPDRFSSWLYRIATNTLRDHLRGEARKQKRTIPTEELDLFEAEKGARDPNLTEDVEKLLDTIRELPARLREPLLLRHSQDLSYKEIGKILGIRENTVQVRIFRARKMLRKRFQEQEKLERHSQIRRDWR